MVFQEVHKGIDSLYLSFWGILKTDLKTELENKKLLAQSDDEKEQAQARLDICDHHFEVQDKGKGKFAFVLKDNWFYIQISGSTKKKLPTVYVQLSSEILNCLGLENSVSQLKNIVSHLLVSIEREHVSRTDIFVDCVTDTDFESIDRKQWVGWAVKVDCHWTGLPFSGWSIGLGGAISARLYDKTVEIEQKSHKEYFKPLWQKQGWQEGQNVWRLEFQLRREFLDQMSVNSVQDLNDMSNDLWRYCTHDWVKLAIDDGTINRTRLEVTPYWAEIQNVLFGAGDYTGIVREVNKSREPSDETLFLNGYGFFLSYVAREGYENILEALLNYKADAEKFHEKYTKNSTQYNSAEDYTKTKLAMKKRKFNKKTE